MTGPDDELLEAVRERLADPPAPPTVDPDPFDVPGLRVGTLIIEGIDLPPGSGPPLPPGPPVGRATVDTVAAHLGVDLPPLLVRLYTEVADGGFGPGDGAVPVASLPDLWQEHAVEMVDALDLEAWPVGLVPFCRVDQTLLHCVDCTAPDGPVVGFEFDDLDPDADGGLPDALSTRAPSLAAWLRDWLAEPAG